MSDYYWRRIQLTAKFGARWITITMMITLLIVTYRAMPIRSMSWISIQNCWRPSRMEHFTDSLGLDAMWVKSLRASHLALILCDGSCAAHCPCLLQSIDQIYSSLFVDLNFFQFLIFDHFRSLVESNRGGKINCNRSTYPRPRTHWTNFRWQMGGGPHQGLQ